MTATLTVAAANTAAVNTAVVTEELDPRAARAQFFFDLEMAELTAVIPQAAPVAGIQRY